MGKNKHQRNIEYVLYDGEDRYIVGFNSLTQLSQYLGNTKPALSKIFSRYRTKQGKVNKNLEEGVTECSQRIYTYTRSVIDKFGHNLGRKCSVYKFWEE